MKNKQGSDKSPKRELRVYASPQKFEVRRNSDGSRSVQGYFATFNTLSHDIGFREKILPGAFTQSLKDVPVRALFNHSDDKLLGRTESGTLQVHEDSKGLRFDVTLPIGVSYADDLVVLMERGDAYECSWGFSVPDGGDDWSVMPDGNLLRTISTAILYEGSILVSPAAYPNTSASLRSLPKALRAKLKRNDDNSTDPDCDPDVDDDCDPDATEEERCDCDCSACLDGDCDECTNEDCDDDDCEDCPMQDEARSDRLRVRKLIAHRRVANNKI